MPPARRTRSRTQNPPNRGRPPPRLPLIPIIVGVISLLAVIAVIASRGGGGRVQQPRGIEQTRPVSVRGEPLAKYGDSVDAALGAVAPQLAGARFDGTSLAISADGRSKVLVFLAHWCPHCEREVPVLADWLSTNGAPHDVDLYAIATSTTPDRPNFPPSAWLEREGWKVPTLADSTDSLAAQAFGLTVFPYFVAVDRQNHVVARLSGELTIQQWEALLGRARSGSTTSTSASNG